jgi:hypothetical protein
MLLKLLVKNVALKFYAIRIIENFSQYFIRLLEVVLNRLILILCASACAFPSFAAESGDAANRCVVGGVKLSWKPIKHCLAFDSEAKFKATLDAWGWGEQALPPIDWSKEAVVIDSGNNPYGNGVASCGGVVADPGKKALTLRWGWQQQVEPSAAARRKNEAETKGQDAAANDKTIGEKAKDSVIGVATDAKQTVKDLVDDVKKFPSPIPKRAAIVAVISKDLLGGKPRVECIVQK